ncbi:hypothetical protein BSKO_01064 [Bryopsis sp. KO-2023]|nr:hypothetical protein BSKO_01064 [Bryopsis sp. KO-2023]
MSTWFSGPDFHVKHPSGLGERCKAVTRDRGMFWLLLGLLALLPSSCSANHPLGPLLFNGTLGVGDCDLNESTTPASEGTVIHDCVFSAIVRKCSGEKLSDPGLIFNGCRGRICENDLSISTTECILDSMGLNYTEGLENDKYKCGIPLVNKDLFDVKEITWVDSVPGSRRCALRIPHGSKIEQNIICIGGFARLRFTLMLVEKLTDDRYSCELNPRCNSYLGIYGDSICYKERSVEEEASEATSNGSSDLGRFKLWGFTGVLKVWVHGVVISLSILFFSF